MASEEDLQSFLDQPLSEESYNKLSNVESASEIIKELDSASLPAGRYRLIVYVIEKMLRLTGVLLDVLRQEELWPFLVEAASSKNVSLRKLLATQLSQMTASLGSVSSENKFRGGNISTNDEDVYILLRQSGLWAALRELILDSDLVVAEAAIKAVEKGIQYEVLLDRVKGNQQLSFHDILISDQFLDPIIQASEDSENSTQQMRVFALAVSLGRISPFLFTYMNKLGLYDKILEVYRSDDVLMKLNCIELISELGTYSNGLELLSTTHLPKYLMTQIDDPLCDDQQKIAVLHLIGKLIEQEFDSQDKQEHRARASLAAELIRDNIGRLSRTIENFLLERDDATKILCGVKLWGSVMMCPSAELPPTLADKVASQMNHPSNDEISKAVFHSWAIVVASHIKRHFTDALLKGQEASNDISLQSLDTVVRKIVIPNVLEILQGRPFPDVRCHVYGFLAAISPIRSAMETVLSSEPQLKIILDFQSESEYEARLAKHLFVKSLMKHHGNSEWLKRLLGNAAFDSLKDYASKGPFYAPLGSRLFVDDSTR